MGDHIEIRAAKISETAGLFATLTDEASGMASSCADASIAAAARNAGWASSGALDSCARQWENKINSLVSTMGTVGESLASSSELYTRADAEIAGSFYQILGSFADDSWSAG